MQSHELSVVDTIAVIIVILVVVIIVQWGQSCSSIDAHQMLLKYVKIYEYKYFCQMSSRSLDLLSLRRFE